MKYWWCQTCNLLSTARCKYRNNIFFHVLTKMGTSQYHLLQGAEMDNNSIPNWFGKWAYCFWESLPEYTLRIQLWHPMCAMVWQTSATPQPHPTATFLKNFTLRSSEHENGAEKAKKRRATMAWVKQKYFIVYSDTTFWFEHKWT